MPLKQVCAGKVLVVVWPLFSIKVSQSLQPLLRTSIKTGYAASIVLSGIIKSIRWALEYHSCGCCLWVQKFQETRFITTVYQGINWGRHPWMISVKNSPFSSISWAHALSVCWSFLILSGNFLVYRFLSFLENGVLFLVQLSSDKLSSSRSFLTDLGYKFFSVWHLNHIFCSAASASAAHSCGRRIFNPRRGNASTSSQRSVSIEVLLFVLYFGGWHLFKGIIGVHPCFGIS